MTNATSGVPTERVLRIGAVECGPGATASGVIPVAGGTGGPIALPVILVNGTRPGPVLCVCGGIHGDEYDGMEAVRLVVERVDPADLSGALVAVPCVNVVAFEGASRESRADGANLNRIFPGSETGTITQRIAAMFLREIVPHIDALVDLHTGGTFGEIAPLAIVQGGYEALAGDLGRAAGHEFLWAGGKWGGTARLSTLHAGKPAITIEAGGGTCREDIVALHVASVENIMRHLGILAGAATRRERFTAVDGSFTLAAAGGFFRPHARPGERVVAGQTLAQTVDHLGGILETFTAPSDGMILWMRRLRTILAGQEAVIFARTSPVPE